MPTSTAQTEAQLLGQFSLTTFTNEKGLEAIGSNLYRETEASGAANAGDAGEDGRGTFRQGYLENSSVDAVREITGLIEAQRGYELNAKVITAADQMLAATDPDPLNGARAATIFTLFVAVLAAGAVLAQSVQPVRAIRSQTVIEAEDLDAGRRRPCRARSARSRRRSAGRRKVALYPGRPILESQLGAPALIERNAVVRMPYARGALSIVTEGRALDRAARRRAGAGDEPRLAADRDRAPSRRTAASRWDRMRQIVAPGPARLPPAASTRSASRRR